VLRPIPSEIGGYVLAGGRSSRMGRDKALLELVGKPLVLHAVVKLRRVCIDVSILGSDPALDAYAPLVKDLHPGCGPIGGMEAALLHSRHDWNMFLPVDMPFVPSAYLRSWVGHHLDCAAGRGARVLMFRVDGLPQPTLALVHREIQPFLTESIERSEYRLFQALEKACLEVSMKNGRLPGVGLWAIPYWSNYTSKPGPRRTKVDWCYTTEAQERASGMWFRNLNTLEDFSEAVQHSDVLDT
jgi:molybdopterin-guanine dinucleotide biosynthesis protein A